MTDTANDVVISRNVRTPARYVQAVVSRAVKMIESRGPESFIASGVLCTGGYSVYEDETEARSGDGWLLKAGYEEFLARWLQNEKNVLRSIAIGPVSAPNHHGDVEAFATRVAQVQAARALDMLNATCITACDMSVVTISDWGGRELFLQFLKKLQTKELLLRM